MKKLQNLSSLIIVFHTLTMCLSVYPKMSVRESLFGQIPYKLCWEISSPDIRQIFGASDNEKAVYLFNGNIQKINLSDGKIIWSTALGQQDRLQVFEDERHLYTASQGEKSEYSDKSTVTLRQISKSTGITNWTKNIDLNENYYVRIHDKSIFITDKGGQISALNKNNQLIMWQSELDGNISNEPFITDRYIILNLENKVLLLSIESGKKISEIRLEEKVNRVYMFEERIYTVDYRGYLKSYNSFQEKLNWEIRFGGEVKSIIEAGKNILVSSQDNFLYLLSKESGQILWRKRLPGRIIEGPVISGNEVIVTVYGTGTGYVLDLKDGELFKKIELSNNIEFISRSLVSNNFLVFLTTYGVSAFSGNCPGGPV